MPAMSPPSRPLSIFSNSKSSKLSKHSYSYSYSSSPSTAATTTTTTTTTANSTSSPPLPPPPAEDRYLSFDVQAALFPSGFKDLPTPEAIKSLQNNAEAVIADLLSAYKLRTFALHDTLREKETQDVQLEEMEMRLQHVRTQLDGMAERVLEQEGLIKAMTDELRLERLKKHKLEAAASAAFAAAGRVNALSHLASVGGGEKGGIGNGNGNGNGNLDDSSVQEDGTVTAATTTTTAATAMTSSSSSSSLQKQLAQSKRASNSTMFTTDSGFESGDDVSVADSQSIFSRNYDSVSSASTIVTSPSLNSRQQPAGAGAGGIADPAASATNFSLSSSSSSTATTTATSTQQNQNQNQNPHSNNTSTTTLLRSSSPAPSITTTATTPSSSSSSSIVPISSSIKNSNSNSSSRLSLTTPRGPNKPSTYDRVLKGFASTGFGSAFKTSRCSNCSGVSASDAWSIINIMRDENRGLKDRIGDLESAMEDVITLVGG